MISTTKTRRNKNTENRKCHAEPAEAAPSELGSASRNKFGTASIDLK